MSSHDHNVYYAPETWGLKSVGEIEYSTRVCEFDTRVIWQDGVGNFFTARDKGCSCPTPFGDFNTFEDLEIPTLKILIDEINNNIKDNSMGNLQTAMLVIDKLLELGLR
ncbi:MAG TPA: hypothetical protein DIC42_06840 [Holosporales bacterium]|nr:hypothetical protein [Holosporales bacterium]